MEDLDWAAKFNETISAAAGQERNFGIIAERTEVGWLLRRIYNFGGSGSNASTISWGKVSLPSELEFISKSYEMKFLWESGRNVISFRKNVEAAREGMEIGGEEERKLLSIVDSGAAAAAPKAFYHISSPAKLPKVALSIFSLSLSLSRPGPPAPVRAILAAGNGL